MPRMSSTSNSPRRDNVRRLGCFWALPATLIGMVFAALALCSSGKAAFRGGVLEVHGGLVGRLLRGNRFHTGSAAMALGHVILARDKACLDRSREHELFHVRQFERWGLLLLPAYWFVSLSLRLRGYDPYLDHPFEPYP